MSAPTSALPQQTYKVSDVLALQKLLRISLLPAHLAIRAVLLVGDISDAERDSLTRGHALLAGEVDPEVAVIMRALVHADTEIQMTLGATGRMDTRIVIARSNKLIVIASHCGDDVTIDAYLNVNTSADLARLILATAHPYMFGDNVPSVLPFRTAHIPAAATFRTLNEYAHTEWVENLNYAGVPADIAGYLHDSETNLKARVEVAAALCREGSYIHGSSVLRATAISGGGILTSVVIDNGGNASLRVDPYDLDTFEQLIVSTIDTVGGGIWFAHRRTDPS